MELTEPYGSVEDTVSSFVNLIQSMSYREKLLWNKCDERTINIGIQAGTNPHEKCFSLSSGLLSSLARFKCDAVFTVYAPHD
jgi:hypothetical protein